MTEHDHHPAPPPAEQAESALTEALRQLHGHAETASQALRLIDSATPSAARGALLAMETLVSEALGLSVWMFHLRGEHDRARDIVGIETSVQRATTEALAREPR